MTSSPTPAQQIERIKGLNAKRTPGHYHERLASSGQFRLYLQADKKTIADYRYKNGYGDLAFAAAGPHMVEIISTLEAKLGVARGALTLALHTIEPVLLSEDREFAGNLPEFAEEAIDTMRAGLAASSLETAIME